MLRELEANLLLSESVCCLNVLERQAKLEDKRAQQNVAGIGMQILMIAKKNEDKLCPKGADI